MRSFYTVSNHGAHIFRQTNFPDLFCTFSHLPVFLVDLFNEFNKYKNMLQLKIREKIKVKIG